MSAASRSAALEPAVPAPAAAALVTVFVKEVGGRVHIFEDARRGQPLGAFSGRFAERQLNPRSTLYVVPEAQWAAAKANPSAFVAENDPADDEAPVEANMRLLADPPAPQAPVGTFRVTCSASSFRVTSSAISFVLLLPAALLS
jgi:hypothetical protein